MSISRVHRFLLLSACAALLPTAGISQRYFANRDTKVLPWSAMLPTNSEVGDIDGDGDLDVIAGRNVQGDPRLTLDTPVLLWVNEGKGVFTEVSKRIPTGNTNLSLDPHPRFADVDNDKDLDIVLGFDRVYSTSQRQLRVFLNNGKGRFTELANAAPAKLGSRFAFAFLDIDQDGDLDIAASTAASLTILINNGKGVFSPAKRSVAGYGNSYHEVLIVDVDRDKDSDVILAGFGTWKSPAMPLLYLNDGKGNLSQGSGRSLPRGTRHLSQGTVADVTGDGISDIVYRETYSDSQLRTKNRPILWRGDGKGGFQNISLPIPAGFEDLFYDISVGDLDGDKDLDLLWTNQNHESLGFGQVRMLENLGKGRFTMSKKVPVQAPARMTRESLLADFDGDGRTDVLLLGEHSRLFLRDAKYNYILHGTDQLAGAGILGVFDVGDFNRDGLPDVFHHFGSMLGFSRGFTGWPSELLLGTPGGEFSLAAKGSIPPLPIFATSVASGDLDGDGDRDIVMTRVSQPLPTNKLNTLLFLNQGKGIFKDATLGLPDLTTPATALVCLDADRDGDLDLIIARGRSSVSLFAPPQRNRLFLNNGKAIFKEASTKQFPGIRDNTSCLAVGDLDLDGDLDLVVGNQSRWLNANTRVRGQTRIFLNDGKGTFKEKVGGFPTQNLEPTSLTIADFDGDKKPDIFLTAYQGQANLFLGNGKGVFSRASRFPSIPGNMLGAAAGDIDGDGDQDLVVLRGMNSNDKWGQYLLLRNDGKSGFRWIQDGLPEELRTQLGGNLPRLVDMDGDGDLDLIALHQVFENNLRQISFQGCPRTGFPLEVTIESSPGRLAANRLAALFFQTGAAPMPVALPPFGRLGLDPRRTQLLSIELLPVRTGTKLFTMPLPNNPTLLGIELGIQALIAEGVAPNTWRFTNRIGEPIR